MLFCTWEFATVIHRKGGNFILDRYRILNCISAHEHSSVWLAEHRALHTKRIIKGIRRSSPVHDRLAAEATTLMKLSHPGIPSVFDVDEDDEFTYIIEEFIEGETLKSFYLKRVVPEGQFLDHLEQICSILEYLQDRSIRLIHLDLKPENIMISDCVRIIDFGTAEREGTGFDFRFVTAGYSAPELKKGENPGKEGDVFSLGKLIFFMVDHSAVGRKMKKRLLKIAGSCVEEERKNRVGSGVIVTKMLRRATKKKKELRVRVCLGMKAEKIAVFGLCRGCGVTHIAVSLACTLAMDGFVIFSQKRQDRMLAEYFTRAGKGRAGRGVTYVTCELKSGHPAVSVIDSERDNAVRKAGNIGSIRTVVDMGTGTAGLIKEALAKFDVVILVGGGALWRHEDYDFIERMAREEFLGPGFRVLMNMAGPDAGRMLPLGIKAFRFPYEENPFSPGFETRKLFGKIVGGS